MRLTNLRSVTTRVTVREVHSVVRMKTPRIHTYLEVKEVKEGLAWKVKEVGRETAHCSWVTNHEAQRWEVLLPGRTCRIPALPFTKGSHLKTIPYHAKILVVTTSHVV